MMSPETMKNDRNCGGHTSTLDEEAKIRRDATDSIHHPNNATLKFSSSLSSRPLRTATDSTTPRPKVSMPRGTLKSRFCIAHQPMITSRRKGGPTRRYHSTASMGIFSLLRRSTSSSLRFSNTPSNFWRCWSLRSVVPNVVPVFTAGLRLGEALECGHEKRGDDICEGFFQYCGNLIIAVQL